MPRKAPAFFKGEFASWRSYSSYLSGEQALENLLCKDSLAPHIWERLVSQNITDPAPHSHKKFKPHILPSFVPFHVPLSVHKGAAPLVPKLKMAGVPGGGFAEFMKNNPSGIEKEKKEKKSKKRKHGDEKKSRKERKVNIDDDDL